MSTMDSMEPEQTPFAAVSAQTSKFARVSFTHLLAQLCFIMDE